MIQVHLMEELQAVIPGLTWTVDYHSAKDNTGSVYATSGRAADKYDTEYRYPGYQVWIRSSDWDFAKLAAELVYKRLHKKGNFKVNVDYEKGGEVVLTKRYRVFLILATSDPIRIGANNEIMEYSVNFDVTLKEEEK